jgi:hypothetical protein
MWGIALDFAFVLCYNGQCKIIAQCGGVKVSFKTLSEENKEFIAKLYSLKAGLSLLSLEADKTRIEESKDKYIKDCIENKKYKLEGMKRNLAGLSQQIEKNEAIVSNGKKAFLIRLIIGLCLLVACPVVGLPLTLISAVLMAISTMLAIPFMAFMFIFIIGSFIAGTVLIDQSLKKRAPKFVKVELERCREAHEKQASEISSLEALLADDEAAFRKHAENHEKKLQEYKERSQEIYTALVQDYDDVLERRDWANLDYIIYVYETGRADALMSALHLLDEEKCHEGILAAINYASAEISQNIRSSIEIMGERLAMNMQTLGDRIEANGRKTREAIAGASAEASRYASALNSSITVQNALLEKSNVTSAQLAGDVNYVVERYKLTGRL